jgi:NADP-dependent 3-hydroxy acid dehydrogenase YdfG
MAVEGSRVWLITGASSGPGRALAESALDRGERVVATARDPKQLDDLVERFPESAMPVRLDVTDQDEASAAIDAGVTAFDRIDVVVNNAGYGLFGALEDSPTTSCDASSTPTCSAG